MTSTRDKMHVARMPVRRASGQEEYTMKKEMSDHGLETLKDADCPTRCWHAIDVRCNRSNRTITIAGRPIQQQYQHYKDGKTSAMDAIARSGSFGSDIGDLALHQPIRWMGEHAQSPPVSSDIRRHKPWQRQQTDLAMSPTSCLEKPNLQKV